MSSLVTGAAGFLGRQVVSQLLANGEHVTGLDRRVATDCAHIELDWLRVDLVGEDLPLSPDVETVYHLAAYADVRTGVGMSARTFEDNTMATYHLLEGLRYRAPRLKRIVFASSAAVYGDSACTPHREQGSWPRQTSMYGASKVAGEALMQAYAEAYGFTSVCLRFVSMLGPRYRHGHVIDWYRQLQSNPRRLKVLNNGLNVRQYVDVRDAARAVLLAGTCDVAGQNRVWNVSTAEPVTVRQSVDYVCRALRLTPEVLYGTDTKGWIGDQAHISVSTALIRAQGWIPQFSVATSYVDTVRDLQAHPQEVNPHG